MSCRTNTELTEPFKENNSFFFSDFHTDIFSIYMFICFGVHLIKIRQRIGNCRASIFAGCFFFFQFCNGFIRLQISKRILRCTTTILMLILENQKRQTAIITLLSYSDAYALKFEGK